MLKMDSEVNVSKGESLFHQKLEFETLTFSIPDEEDGTGIIDKN